MWFAAGPGGTTIYALAGGRERSDWVANLIVRPLVHVRVGPTEGDATARVVAAGTDEDALARHLLLAKYRRSGEDLEGWGRDALPVAFDLGFAGRRDPMAAEDP